MDSCWKGGAPPEHGAPIVRACWCACGQAYPLYTAELAEPTTEEARAEAEGRPVPLGWKCASCGAFHPCRLGAGIAY
jgi:hypothetical protein